MDELVKELQSRTGTIYRIELEYVGADPRIKLRNTNKLSKDELAELAKNLVDLDAASKIGPWTKKILTAIQRHPKLSAGELAEKVGYEKDWLKLNIRKLKNLGLTISHHPGYEISPRGMAVLKRLKM